LFTVEARKRLPYPDAAIAAVRIGHLRRCAFPESTDSVSDGR
jgi:hypothetical protein